MKTLLTQKHGYPCPLSSDMLGIFPTYIFETWKKTFLPFSRFHHFKIPVFQNNTEFYFENKNGLEQVNAVTKNPNNITHMSGGVS